MDHGPLSLTPSLVEDCLLHCFSFLDGYHLVQILLVCKRWRDLVDTQSNLWENVCSFMYWTASSSRLSKLVQRAYKGSWKSLFRCQPHLRYDGFYFLKVSYFTPGSFEKKEPNKISYFRYLRFFPNGEVWYALLNYDIGDAVELFRSPDPPLYRKKLVYKGSYRFNDKTVKVAVNVGYLVVKMVIEFRQGSKLAFCGPNSCMELVSFMGDRTHSDETLEINSPTRNFLFRIHDW